MRWECSECGATFEQHRRPVVCGTCGIAGARFVEAEVGLEGDPDADSLFDAWMQRGIDFRPKRTQRRSWRQEDLAVRR